MHETISPNLELQFQIKRYCIVHRFFCKKKYTQYCVSIDCIQDTLSAIVARRARPVFRPSASFEQRYLAYNVPRLV